MIEQKIPSEQIKHLASIDDTYLQIIAEFAIHNGDISDLYFKLQKAGYIPVKNGNIVDYHNLDVDDAKLYQIICHYLKESGLTYPD